MAITVNEGKDITKINIKGNTYIPVTFEKIEDYTSENGDNRITKVKITLMHLGLNYNDSIFNKDIVDKAIPTLAYCPILGFIQKDKITGENDFSDHRYVIIKDDKGVRRKYLGSAYGVILSNDENNARYEEKLCDDGETRTYLVVDGIMWNMFEDSIDIMKRDVIKSESMELAQLSDDDYEGYEDEQGNFVFTKFSFRGACILGTSYEPAMQGANVEVVNFTMSDFIKDIQSELNNKYTTFTKMLSETSKNKSSEIFDEMLNEKSMNKGGSKAMANTDFSQTVMAMFSDMAAIVANFESIENRWGEKIARYSLADIQENEAIVVDRKDNWNYYGMTYTVEGDKPVIDFTSATRKKVVFENYDEGTNTIEGAFDFGRCIDEIESVAFEKVTEAESKVEAAEFAKTEAESAKETAETNYNTIKSELDEIKPKYEDYVAAEQKRANDELNAKRDEMLALFESALSDNEDYIAIKTNKADYTVDEIEAKCSILLFRKNKNTIFSKPTKEAVVGIPDVGNDDVDNGYVATKYGNIPVRK